MEQIVNKKQFKFTLDWTVLISAVVLPIIGYTLIYLSKTLYFKDGAIACWPTGGVYLAAMLRLGYRIWPAALLSEFTINQLLFSDGKLSTFIVNTLISPVTVIDVLVTTFLIHRIIKRRNPLERSEDIFKFVLLLIPSPLVTNTYGVTVQALAGITPWASFGDVLRNWLIQGFTSYLVIIPMLLTWSQRYVDKQKSLKKFAELGCLLLLVIIISWTTFSSGYPLEYMLIPPLIWAVFRFGQRESTTLVFIISVIAIYGTGHGFGSFAKHSVVLSLFLLQSFICVVALTTLILSGVINENKKAAAKLKRANDELEQRVEERTLELQQAKIIADTANQAKSEFLASMSHELRTPLNGILGYAQILQRSKVIPEKEHKGINIIHQCGEHLLTLINDVLDLSKIEAKKMELHPKDFHFPSFLQSVVEICSIRAEQKGISFDYRLNNQLPIAICADDKRLRQVLINLLGNAIKFTDTGGVTFKVEVLENGMIRFLIEDTGVGMAPDVMEKIFLPFEQVGSSEKQIEGTGLGLAISHKVVSLMGATINVESQLGVGSTFWFDIEFMEAKEWTNTHNTQKGTVIGFESEKRKILIVDDRWENRSVLVNLLQPIGFEVLEATNGEEGLEKAIQEKPDLIITDLAMPVMDGFTMTKHLRELEEFENSLIIASSASVFDFHRHEAVLSGCNDFLPKPVQVEELFSQLQNHLQLQWIYEQSQKLATNSLYLAETSVMDIPPASALTTLYEAAQRCDVADIQAAVLEIERLDKKYKAFTEKVLFLADEFEMEAIVSLINIYIIDCN
ncbi:hypothetical protein DSM106972_068290 [Dulcicalothrix desertica PCC 7102]|uniref:Circadian input-output histidine kinase CikA n=1 Tax=Dulcicalothrix desertica PCC 7102 TaxID=232991 RepID=A0A433V5A4_9CYAN|nr:MASE1 domain-containing protein [Dulcicalothrix desertica]RUT01278.1 hypothetical protein DSM106972_068290 [Dulcicalothrix desertica PCC 7102]TWH40572.1 signal transduction histidine kinase [Dulcicalothrix desertica PCC 7102]